MNEGVNLSIYSVWEIDERRVGDERYKCHNHRKWTNIFDFECVHDAAYCGMSMVDVIINVFYDLKKYRSKQYQWVLVATCR